MQALQTAATPAQPARNVLLLAAMAAGRMTGKRLALEIKRHPVTVSRILHCRQQVTPETARRIASALGSTPAALGICVNSVCTAARRVDFNGARKGGAA